MNKVFGIKSDYAPVKDDASRMVVCYGMEEVDEENATWYEVYLYKAQISQVTLDVVKNAVIEDINAQTDENVLTGFVWNNKPVWLSMENQFNFKSGYDLAVQTNGANLPIKYKIGQDEDGNPVYHTFTTVNTITDFFTKGTAYIIATLNDGWARKDSIDWQPYEEALEQIEAARQAAAEEAARLAAEEEAARLAAEEAAKQQEEEEQDNMPNIEPTEEPSSEE